MIPLAVALYLIVLPATALAQAEGGALGPTDPSRQAVSEPMSRAQIAQMIADRGFFEMSGLAPQQDGSWTCTAMAGPDRRVRLTVDKNGTITQKDLPREDAR
jgi:hypothetical protein